MRTGDVGHFFWFVPFLGFLPKQLGLPHFLISHIASLVQILLRMSLGIPVDVLVSSRHMPTDTMRKSWLNRGSINQGDLRRICKSSCQWEGFF